jgi:hypothetical protein
MFTTYYKEATLSVDVKEELLWGTPFLFPSKVDGRATTSFETILKYGYVPAIYVKFYSSIDNIPIPPRFNGNVDKY